MEKTMKNNLKHKTATQVMAEIDHKEFEKRRIRLIKASPVLLVALKKCLACLNMDSDMQKDFAQEIALAQKAIKEAE